MAPIQTLVSHACLNAASFFWTPLRLRAISATICHAFVNQPWPSSPHSPPSSANHPASTWRFGYPSTRAIRPQALLLDTRDTVPASHKISLQLADRYDIGAHEPFLSTSCRSSILNSYLSRCHVENNTRSDSLIYSFIHKLSGPATEQKVVKKK